MLSLRRVPSPTPVSVVPWVVGSRPARPLAEGLGATLHELPRVVLDADWSAGPLLEAWRDGELGGPRVASSVVAVWTEAPVPTSVGDLEIDGWTAGMETGFALWFAALSVACSRCEDGGQVVAVTERPEPKASAGWALPSAVADAVEVMARSLRQVERSRGVRVNVVSSSARLGADPSSPWDELLGAVGMLLAAGGPAVDGAVIRVGAGR